MEKTPVPGIARIAALLLSALLLSCSTGGGTTVAGADNAVPRYEVDASWPRPLPNRWGIGQVAGIATDANDHVWLIHRPRSMTEDERGASLPTPRSVCCIPAPAVLEFDAQGRVLRSWGGPGQGYEWPQNEHGIYVDHKGNVWIGGNGENDHQLLKFTPDGKFLLQIGRAGQTGGSNSTTLLGRPAHMETDPATNELIVADGYRNRRVIVFDADTGAYKRHWGAYGERPDDAPPRNYVPGQPPSRQFANPVHCARQSKDGLLYVCDRINNRIQVFTKDGRFQKEFFIGLQTRGSGSVWDLVLSHDAGQRWLHIVDGENNQVWTVQREDGRVVDTFGRNGRNAGQFHWVHNVAMDSAGNLYTSEVDTGKRAQKFRYLGLQAPRQEAP